MPKVVSIDIETTGLNKENDQIYQIGIVYCEIPGWLHEFFIKKVGSWKEYEEAIFSYPNMKGFQLTTCPVLKTDSDKECAKQALSVSNWTIEELEDLPTPVFDRMESVINSDCPHYSKLEIPSVFENQNLLLHDEKALLEKFFRILNKLNPDVLVTHNGFHFDIPFIDSRMCKYDMEWYFEKHEIDTKIKADGKGFTPTNLKFLSEMFGITNERPHNAFYDALTTLKVALRLCPKEFRI